MMTKYMVSVLSLLLSGCIGGPPTAAELAKADYGSPITQQQAELIVNQWLKSNLKDPESAKIEWGVVQKGWIREAIISGSQLKFGYLLKANVNAKNSFGGYTGYKACNFVFKNNQLILAEPADIYR